MPSLIARFASNMFWLGRYMERAECLARIIDTNETYSRDDGEGPDWARVLNLYADQERFRKKYRKADEVSVLSFYMLDRDNTMSMLSNLQAARQNARSVRHLISTEMWTHLNTFYNRMARMTPRDIGSSNLSQSCNEVKIGCQTFEGIAEGTFFRGEAWCFNQLGKYVERADQTTRILDMGYDFIADEQGQAMRAVHWKVLLRSVSGYHAYRSRHPAISKPQDVATFLLYDESFPRAVALCVNQITRQTRALESRYDLRPRSAVEDARRALEFLLETGLGQSITRRRLHVFLDELQKSIGGVSDALSRTYFG